MPGVLHLHLSRDSEEKISPQTVFFKTRLRLVQVQGGLSKYSVLLACQLPPDLALLPSKAESCALDATWCTAPPEAGELGAFIEHQAFSTHVLSGDALHVHAKCLICSSCAKGL